MNYLRLDLYINGREYLVDETDEATAEEFERAVRNAAIVFQRCDDALRTDGAVTLTADEITDEDMQNVLWDFVGEVKATDEVSYVMCLWNAGEHVQSCVTLAEMSS